MKIAVYGFLALNVLAFFVIVAICITDLLRCEKPITQCEIQLRPGVIKHDTSCRPRGKELECSNGTYGQYLNYVCKKGDQ